MTTAAVDSQTISHSLINLFFQLLSLKGHLVKQNCQLVQCGRMFLQVTLVTDHSLTLIFALNILIMQFNKIIFLLHTEFDPCISHHFYTLVVNNKPRKQRELPCSEAPQPINQPPSRFKTNSFSMSHGLPYGSVQSQNCHYPNI